VSKDRSSGESFFELIEGQLALLGEVPGYVFSCKVGQGDDDWNNDVGVVINELSVEICKTKERLDVSHLLQLRPVVDCLNLLSGHGETGGGKNITKVLDRVRVKLTLLQLGIKAMLSKAVEYLFYMFAMRLHVYHDADINHVCKDAIDKSLESHRHVSQTKWHYLPLIRTIMSAESCFPFISICYADQMIGMVEINLGVDFSAAWRVE
ncbi:hypothetical protein M404DRAFT_120097, partial [Pisolithus tinctorius Marx 270]